MRYVTRTLVRLAAVVVALSVPVLASGQQAQASATTNTEPTNLSSWLRARIDEAKARRTAVLDGRLTALNGNGVANQKESPSMDASTSLVDTSSASDFVSLALNLSGLHRPQNGEASPTSGSVTASLYSLAAAATGRPVTDPEFYKSATGLRRLSLTLGSEESKAEDHFTNKPSINVGAKYLILNDRDVYSGAAQAKLGALEQRLDAFLAEKGRFRDEIECMVFRAVKVRTTPLSCRGPEFEDFLKEAPFGPKGWPITLETLEANPAAMARITEAIERIAGVQQEFTQRIADAVERIQQGRQLAIAYYTKQREDSGTDEHRTELIFDYGISTRLNWTLNASFDYRDRKQKDDTRSGRFATEFQAKLSNPDSHLWSARPVILSGSSEATKSSGSATLIRAQVKLVVPIMTGIDVPIAYSYANRDDEGIVAGSQLKFSLAVDPVRLRERLR